MSLKQHQRHVCSLKGNGKKKEPAKKYMVLHRSSNGNVSKVIVLVWYIDTLKILALNYLKFNKRCPCTIVGGSGVVNVNRRKESRISKDNSTLEYSQKK